MPKVLNKRTDIIPLNFLIVLGVMGIILALILALILPTKRNNIEIYCFEKGYTEVQKVGNLWNSKWYCVRVGKFGQDEILIFNE